MYKYLDDLSQERDDLRSYFLNSINDVDKRVAFLSLVSFNIIYRTRARSNKIGEYNTQIHIGYRTARSADTGILKLQILGLMCEEEDEDLKENLINKGKEARGYAHPQVCELLLPAEMAVKDDPALVMYMHLPLYVHLNLFHIVLEKKQDWGSLLSRISISLLLCSTWPNIRRTLL